MLAGSRHHRRGRFFDPECQHRRSRRRAHRALVHGTDPGRLAEKRTALADGQRGGSAVRNFRQSAMAVATKKTVALFRVFADAVPGAVARRVTGGGVIAERPIGLGAHAEYAVVAVTRTD